MAYEGDNELDWAWQNNSGRTEVFFRSCQQQNSILDPHTTRPAAIYGLKHQDTYQPSNKSI